MSIVPSSIHICSYTRMSRATFSNDTRLPAGNRLWLRFDARYNCEPYSPAFVASDFPRLLADAGLRVTGRGPTPTFLACTTAVKDEGGDGRA